VALLLLACSPPPGASVTIVKSSAQPAEPPALRSGPPLATPGESMLYRLSLQGVELATYQLTIGEITELAGKQAIIVQGHAKASGMALFLATIDDRFTSWIDLATGHSLRFQTDEFASGSKRNVEHAVVDLAARDGDTIPVTFQLDSAPPRLEPQTVSQPVVWDHNAFLLALRSWEAPLGSTISHQVFRSRYLWHVEARIHGKEMLATELGELPALRIDSHTYRLDRKGRRDPDSEERTFTIWISDDEDRVPLAIKAVTDYGALRMRIIDYQPGTARRRP
jgi:hypothetical protein